MRTWTGRGHGLQHHGSSEKETKQRQRIGNTCAHVPAAQLCLAFLSQFAQNKRQCPHSLPTLGMVSKLNAVQGDVSGALDVSFPKAT